MPQSCGHGTDSFTSPPKEGMHSHGRRLRRINEPQFGVHNVGRVRNFNRRAKCQVFCATRLAVGRNTAHWLATAHPNNAPVLHPLTEDRRKTTLSDCKWATCARPAGCEEGVEVSLQLILKLSALIQRVVSFTFRSLYPR